MASGGRHHTSATIPPSVDNAFTRDGAAIPAAGDQNAGQRRSNRTADIEPDAVQGHGGLQMTARNQLGYDRLPGRHDERSSSRGEKRKGKEQAYRHVAKPDREAECRDQHSDHDLDDDQEPTAVDDVRPKPRPLILSRLLKDLIKQR